MKAKHFTCAALFASILFAGACQEPSVNRSEDGLLFLGSEETSDVVERVIAPGSRSLILEGFAGSLTLSASDSDVARLTITRTARGDSPEEAASELTRLDIEETGDETSYRYHFTASDQAMSRFDVEGTVPAQTPIRIRWVAGDIALRETAGNVDVQTQHGDIRYSGSAQTVNLRTRNGSVAAKLSSISAETDANLLTANGDVSVGVPPSSSAHIEASTSAGNIITGPIAFVSESLSPMDAGARFQARLGAGEGRVRLATQHGSIDISTFIPEVKSVPGDSARIDEADLPQADTVIADEVNSDTLIAGTKESGTGMADTETAAPDTTAPDSAPVDSLR